MTTLLDQVNQIFRENHNKLGLSFRNTEFDTFLYTTLDEQAHAAGVHIKAVVGKVQTGYGLEHSVELHVSKDGNKWIYAGEVSTSKNTNTYFVKSKNPMWSGCDLDAMSHLDSVATLVNERDPRKKEIGEKARAIPHISYRNTGYADNTGFALEFKSKGYVIDEHPAGTTREGGINAPLPEGVRKLAEFNKVKTHFLVEKTVYNILECANYPGNYHPKR